MMLIKTEKQCPECGAGLLLANGGAPRYVCKTCEYECKQETFTDIPIFASHASGKEGEPSEC
ncbi:MAG: hypothetical protein FWH17_06095 [Oscillospiraceae bacterium]|nr:hypothetical protein [Oscillospiraceae bacterium]